MEFGPVKIIYDDFHFDRRSYLIFKIIIHVGTNDMKNSSPRHVAKRIVDLGNSIIADSLSTKVTISGLICWSDNSSLNEKATQVNKILNTFANQNELSFLSHSNITSAHLNASGLHLNYKGTYTLFSNLSKYINNN